MANQVQFTTHKAWASGATTFVMVLLALLGVGEFPTPEDVSDAAMKLVGAGVAALVSYYTTWRKANHPKGSSGQGSTLNSLLGVLLFAAVFPLAGCAALQTSTGKSVSEVFEEAPVEVQALAACRAYKGTIVSVRQVIPFMTEAQLKIVETVHDQVFPLCTALFSSYRAGETEVSYEGDLATYEFVLLTVQRLVLQLTALESQVADENGLKTPLPGASFTPAPATKFLKTDKAVWVIDPKRGTDL